MTADRLERQIEFVIEIDKLKNVFRQTLLIDKTRRENSAEHSWHIAVLAILFSEYARESDIDILRVIKMALIHDLVEIDAGDTYCYDEKGAMDQSDREERGAKRIFGILPHDQAEEFLALWREFEEGKTAEASFAAALDRVQPLINNYNTGGEMWREHGIKSDQVVRRNSAVNKGAPVLWEYTSQLIDDAVRRGILEE
ncbi:MAG: HD domain-containing protein [Deltaproteobacteria bacterium]|nr:HD domain-containing protein [Deltaproteobacteria bacterium]